MKRHPDLPTIRTSIKVPKEKAVASETTIRLWFQILRTCLYEWGELELMEDSSRIFNCDEINIKLCLESQKMIGLKSGRHSYDAASSQEESCLSLIESFSASGKIVTPTLIYPYQNLPDDIKNRIPTNFKYLNTPSGWMKSEAFLEYLTVVFCPWLEKNTVKKPVILFVDGHKTHISMSISNKCKNEGIILYLLPPYSRHILQPSDIGPLRLFKEYWSKKNRANQQEVIKHTDVAPYLASVIQTISISSIMDGFKSSGLYPFDVEQVDFTKVLEEDLDCTIEPNDPPDRNILFSEKVFTRGEYQTAKSIIETKLGVDIVSENRGTRTTMSPDLYTLWKLIVNEAEKPQITNKVINLI